MLWIGESTSETGSKITQVALPLTAVIALHASAFTVGVIAAAAWLPWPLIGLPVGAWTDRYRRRPVMLAADAVSLLAFLSVPVAAWLGVLSVPQLLAVALIAGTAAVFFTVAYRAYLPCLVTNEQLTDANSRLAGSEQAATTTGPAVGGLIARAAGAATGMLADAISFAVSAVCLLAIRTAEPPPPKREQRTSLSREIGAGLRFVLRDDCLRPTMIFAFGANLALAGIAAMETPFLLHSARLSAALVGLAIAVAGAVGITGAVFAPRLARALGGPRALIASAWVMVIFAPAFPLATHDTWPLAAAGYGVTLAGGVATSVISRALRQSVTPHQMLGRVGAAVSAVGFGGMPIGALVAGGIADAAGLRPAMWILSALLVPPTVIVAASPMRRMRELPLRR